MASHVSSPSGRAILSERTVRCPREHFGTVWSVVPRQPVGRVSILEPPESLATWLKTILRPGLQPERLTVSPLLDLHLTRSRLGPDAQPKHRARALVVVLKKVIGQIESDEDREATMVLFGAAPGTLGQLLKSRRRQAAERLGVTVATFRRHREPKLLRLVAEKLYDLDVESRLNAPGDKPKDVNREEGLTERQGDAGTIDVVVGPGHRLSWENNREASMKVQEPGKSPASGIIYHGTKFAMPDVYLFWNELFTKAQRRFYLVGKTNKSWISKSTEQSRILGDAIIRIVMQGGQVKVLSSNDPAVIVQTKSFFEGFVVEPSRIKKEMGETIDRAIRDGNIIYSVVPHSNYDAVVSDDRIVLLPIPNSAEFRDEAMVLELTSDGAYHPFLNYLADIDRTVSRGGRISLSE